MSDPLIGELFAGYGGLGMAVQQVYGGELAWYSEFDDAPSRIMAHHHPGVPNYGDVTAIDWGEVPRVDILTGGFPCQDVSVAGRRAGMTDVTRSGLWSHMAHAIDVLRPGLVVIENVGGLFSANAASVMESHPWCLGDDGSGSDTVFLRAIDAVLSTLSELGYDAEWTALRASDVGAPHGRLRVFITAQPQGQPWSVGHGDGDDVADADGRVLGQHRGGAPAEEARADEDHRSASSGGGAGAVALLPTPQAERGTHDLSPGAGQKPRPKLDRIDLLLPTPGANLGENGGPQHPNKRRAGGHSVSIEDAVHGMAVDRLLPTPVVTDSFGARNETSGRKEGSQHHSGRTLGDVAWLDAWGEYGPAIHRWEDILGRPAADPTEPGKTRPRLASRFVEWLMGLPDGHVTGVGLTRNQELKALGNGVVPQQGAAALRYLHTIRTTYLEEMTS